MSGHGEKRSRKEDAALAAVLACSTLTEAAAMARVNESTLRRWMRQPAFRARLRDARQQVVQHSIGVLQNATSEAVETLRRNLTSGSASVEVQAARVILEQSFRATELLDLSERMAELERQLAEPGEGQTT